MMPAAVETCCDHMCIELESRVQLCNVSDITLYVTEIVMYS